MDLLIHDSGAKGRFERPIKKKNGRCDSIEIGFVNGNQEGTGAVENQLKKMIPSGYLT